MNFPEIAFTIIREAQCPLYKQGDTFHRTDNALFLPLDKPICLILAKAIAEVPLNDNKNSSINGNNQIHCGGCSGDVTLSFYEASSMGELNHQDRIIRNIASILSDFSMFQSLDEKSIMELVGFIKMHQYKEGDYIIKKGDPGKNLYIILSGKVNVLGDENIRITTLEKGDVFGEMSLLSGDSIGATIKAATSTKILYLQSKDFRRVLHRYPPLQMYLARLLTSRLAKTNVIRSEEITSGMSGNLSETPPSEICQIINMNQKTGILIFYLPQGKATISFNSGNIISAKHRDTIDRDAFFNILKETKGRFQFRLNLSQEEMEKSDIGHFMCLLMEGVSRMDEEMYSRYNSVGGNNIP